MCIGLRPVLLQFRIIYHDNPVSAVLCQFICQTLHAASHQDSSNLCTKIRRQILAFADQLESDAVDAIVHLLRKDKYAFIFF